MSKEILNTDPRPKCRAHNEGQVSLAGRARLGIRKLDTQVEADVRAVRGMTPLRDGQTGRLSGARDRVTSRRAAPHTLNDTKHSGVSLTHSLSLSHTLSLSLSFTLSLSLFLTLSFSYSLSLSLSLTLSLSHSLTHSLSHSSVVLTRRVVHTRQHNAKLPRVRCLFFTGGTAEAGFFPFVPRRPPALRGQWPLTFRLFFLKLPGRVDRVRRVSTCGPMRASCTKGEDLRVPRLNIITTRDKRFRCQRTPRHFFPVHHEVCTLCCSRGGRPLSQRPVGILTVLEYIWCGTSPARPQQFYVASCDSPLPLTESFTPQSRG